MSVPRLPGTTETALVEDRRVEVVYLTPTNQPAK